MAISTRTPEGEPNRCPLCGHTVRLEVSRPPGDAPCQSCGILLWFPVEPLTPVLTAWEYGTHLIQQREVAAGLAILQSVIARRPGDAEPRRRLRERERSIRNRKRAVNDSTRLELNEVWCDIRQARHKRATPFIDWDAIDRAAERGLAIDPWDADLHVELGRACEARGYLDAARFAYQCAREIAPERNDVREAMDRLAG